MRCLFAAVCMVLAVMCCAKSFADVSYADLFLDNRGYKPVKDDCTDKPPSASFSRNIVPDSQCYKDWCVNTFNNGERIYEAYKEIAFDIDYRAETYKTDYWQTPFETLRDKRGDCEDSVFLFFSMLSELDINGNIIWGWVVDRGSSITFAHVWYQLFDKQGKPYVVEGFSRDWNGIIPIENITKSEERTPTLMLRHSYVNQIVDDLRHLHTHSHRQPQIEFYEDGSFLWEMGFYSTTNVKEIFHKLYDMFARYREQKQK